MADFGVAGGGGGTQQGQGIQPMELGLTVQQTAPIDIKHFLESTLVSRENIIQFIDYGHHLQMCPHTEF